MAHLILDLERYQRDELETRPHPLLGPPSINVGLIQGGVGSNVVADHCTIRVDRRMVPGEDPEVVMAELQAVVAARQAQDTTRVYRVDSFLVSNWFQATLDTPLAQRFLAISAEETGTSPEPVGYLPGSDAKHLVDIVRGSMVVFGPGSYQVAHSTDEFTDIGELVTTFTILQRFLDATLFDDAF
jgi:succinyl-diaminopimelate desuccinylase